MEWGRERQEAREQVQTVPGFKTKGLHHQNSFPTDPRQYKLLFEDEKLVPPAKKISHLNWTPKRKFILRPNVWGEMILYSYDEQKNLYMYVMGTQSRFSSTSV